MNLKDTFASRPGLLAALLVGSLLLHGCGSNGGPDPLVAAQAQERERLQAENQALPQARSENEEVQRLRAENQELPKARSQYQEASRLQKENEQLRQQIARIKPAGGAAGTAGGQGTTVANPAPPDEKTKEQLALEEGALHEGDEILMEPQYLKQLLPDFDWEKLGRKEPLAVRSLLERDGVEITNVLQLQEYGITNYVIQRAPVVPQGQEQGQPAPSP